MFYDRIKLLCEERGEKLTPVTIALGLSKGGLARWKDNANPTADIVIKFADYFGVTSDYLLGKTDDPTPISEVKKTAAEKFSDDLKQIFINAGDIKPGEELSDGLKEYMKDLVRSAVAKRLDDA